MSGKKSNKRVPNLQAKYKDQILGKLKDSLKLSNVNAIPRLEKVVINTSIAEAVSNPKTLDYAAKVIAKISGQKPVITKAKKSIATFKLREGMPIGCMVTLRGQRMYEFIERLITLALPRVKDFRGVSKRGFDGRGNYTLGVKEYVIFPEVNYDDMDKIRGLNITFATTASSDIHSLELLKALGMPFQK